MRTAHLCGANCLTTLDHVVGDVATAVLAGFGLMFLWMVVLLLTGYF